MPYRFPEPPSPDTAVEAAGRLFRLAPVGLAGVALLLIDYAMPLTPILRWTCVAGIATYLLWLTVGWRGDDYLRELTATGSRWCTMTIAGWLASGPVFTFAMRSSGFRDLFNEASISIQVLAPHASPVFNDAYILSLLAAGAYFAGFSVAWWRSSR